MKKHFTFIALALVTAVNVSAEKVFDWAGNVGNLQLTGTAAFEDIKSQTNTEPTACITFANGYAAATETTSAANFAELTLEGSGFKAGDVVVIDYFYNNSSTKVAAVGVYNTDDVELAASPEGINGRFSDGFSTFQYTLTEDMAAIRVARAKIGKTKTCVARLEVYRDGANISKATSPVFSQESGTYYFPFNVALTSAMADKIFVSINNGVYKEYTDSILIDQYDVDYVLSAYATYEGAENSDTVTVTYKLEQIKARPIFNARKTIDLSGITKNDVLIISGDNATVGEYTYYEDSYPSVSYLNMKTNDQKDSVMLISIKGRDGLTLRYKNSSSKSNVLKFPDQYLQADSKNFELWLDDVQERDTIVFVVTAKGSSAPRFNHEYSTACYIDPYQPNDVSDPCFTDGEVFTNYDAPIENDYSGWTNLVYIVQEGHNKIRLKEVAAGFRIAKILVGAYRGEQPEEPEQPEQPEEPIENDSLVVSYLDKDSMIIDSESLMLHLPEAPQIEGFTFIGWDVVAGHLADGIMIQAVYEAKDPIASSVVNIDSTNPAQKLIRNGNVYILTDDKIYSITGQKVKR